MKKLLTALSVLVLGTTVGNLNNFSNENINSNFLKKLRITNGNYVPKGKYPWFCTILPEGQEIKNSGFGGGVLIARNWVLTAGHVGAAIKQSLDVDEKIDFVFGLYNKIDYDKNKLEIKRIKNVIIWNHKNNINDDFDMSHDIALVELEKPIENITPINLYSKKEKPIVNSIVTVIGFGLIGLDNKDNPIYPNNLQEANIPILDDSVSKDSRWEFPYWNSKTEILAGEITGNKRINAAPGDSGGPLIQKKHEKYYVVGIVSHAPIKDDHFKNPEPGIYTFVGAFYDWIQKNINN